MRILNRIAIVAALAAAGTGCADEGLVLPGTGAPSELVAVGGDNQSATVGAMLPSPLVVEVRDGDGNPVSGIGVRWTVEGGGSLSSSEGTTNGSGRATVTWRLGDEAGVQRAIATLDINAGVRQIFTASAVPEGSPRLALATEPPATATSGEPLSQAPVVQLRSDDGSDLRQSGVSVTVTIASGDGELSGTRTRQTDDDGRATFSGLVISGGSGERRLIFAASGVTSVTSRAIDVRAPAPPPSPGTIQIERGNNQSATVGTAVATDPAVKVLDGSGNPKSGVTVTFAVASGGGSVSGATATTNSAGIATVGEWKLGPEAGANTLRATASGYGGSPVTFSATATAAPPPPPPPSTGSIRIERGNNQTATVQTAVATDPAVKVLDGSGNPKSGVTVTFAVALGGGSVSGATATTNSDGVAAVGEWRLGSSPGTNTLTASASGYSGSPVTFTATAVAVPAPTARRLEFADQPRDADEQETLRTVRVRIVDADGKVVTSATHSVRLELVRLSGSGNLNGTTERAAVNGVASFDNLRVHKEGEYRLRATASGLESATSDTFEIDG